MKCESRCGAETLPGVPICNTCLGKLRKTLLDLDDMLSELQIQITRQTKSAPQPGKSSGVEAPVLFDEKASDANSLVVETLADWYTLMRAENPRGVEALVLQGRDQDDKARRLMTWHLRHYVTIGCHEPKRYPDEIAYTLRQATKAVDLKQSKHVIGECSECGRTVRAAASQKWKQCRCGQLYDVQASRQKLTQIGADQLVTARQAEGLGEIDGRRMKSKTILQWAARGKIEPADRNDEPWQFRFGDLLKCHAPELYQ